MVMDINQVSIEFDQKEEFEVGRQALVEILQCNLQLNDQTQFNDMANNLITDQQKLAGFWFAYFTARLKIEQSYDFLLAFEIYGWGAALLEKMQEQSLRPSQCIELRTHIAVMAVEEDRGMHNNHFSNTHRACEEALQLIEKNPNCRAELQKKIAYIEAVKAMSDVLVRRDKGEVITADEWNALQTIMRTAYEKTRDLKVYSSVLKSYLISIDYLREAPTNKLIIEDGRLVSSYYATINSMQVDCLIDALSNDSLRARLISDLKANAFYEPEPPDILSDMSETGQFHIWQFDLPEVKLPAFRDSGISYELNLRFNSLGLLQLKFELELQGADVNCVRHLTNLPLENALDETIKWGEKNYHYLRELADDVFSDVERWFGGNSSLIYSTSEHVSSTLLIETLGDQARPGKLLNFAEVQSHPDWIGLKVPPREVRSTFENWRVQKPHTGIKNIATDLYHADDWVQADGSYALIVQLDQPSWVTEQALENVQVATGARYYMKQLGKMLFDNVRNIQLEYHDDEDIDDKSRYELRNQEKEYRRRVKQLHLLNLEVRDLLHLMDTGGLMRFPDHGRFVQQLFDAAGVNQERKSLQETMKESQETTRFLRMQISNALDQLKEKSSQRFDAVVGFMGILLSVTAFSDMFDILEETGMNIPAIVEVEVVFGAMILIVLYFSIEAIIRRFK